MPIPYPMQSFGRYKLGLAMTYKLLHEQFGFDFGARFMMHQDSDVNPHIAGYARLEYLHALDVGQDTDFERLAGDSDSRLDATQLPTGSRQRESATARKEEEKREEGGIPYERRQTSTTSIPRPFFFRPFPLSRFRDPPS